MAGSPGSEPLVQDFWKRCSSCKKTIPFGALYWACNVSTCNRKRTALHFCTVSCWDAHLAVVRHRDTWAEERTAPSREVWARVEAGEMEWPPREAKPKEPEDRKPDPTAARRTIIRRPG
ncbi:MAG: hypothetical protein HUU37_05260 [Bdellovibrionales bacterium]|nr:hypothetical protein [Bdellovibrionales bacterium]